jgi:hypothetical protein
VWHISKRTIGQGSAESRNRGGGGRQGGTVSVETSEATLRLPARSLNYLIDSGAYCSWTTISVPFDSDEVLSGLGLNARQRDRLYAEQAIPLIIRLAVFIVGLPVFEI